MKQQNEYFFMNVSFLSPVWFMTKIRQFVFQNLFVEEKK
jgi:hypothetical protein